MSEFATYFKIGWQHIVAWEGYDHILFIVALSAIYLLSDWRKVLILVTAFTVGHSITLALSVLNVVRVSTRLIEFLIPVTIFITALFNIIRQPKSERPGDCTAQLFFRPVFRAYTRHGFFQPTEKPAGDRHQRGNTIAFI